MKKIKNFITAGTAAQILDISIDTIRRWDKKGLVKSFRNERNDRLFSIDEIERVQGKVFGNKKNQYRILKNSKKTQDIVL